MKELMLMLIIWIFGTIVNLVVCKIKEGEVSRAELVFAIWLGLAFPAYVFIMLTLGNDSNKKVF